MEVLQSHARRPSPLIRASVALHAGAIGVVLVRPHWWPWALSAVVADHLLLAGSGLWPRSHLLGPNWTHLPPPEAGSAARSPAPVAVAITIDDGPDPEVTPRVLDLLDEHNARATFFCIGERVERHPALARAIVARQHEIGNHTHRHLMRFSLLGPRGVAQEIGRAQEAIGAATGEVARFFRAPAGLRKGDELQDFYSAFREMHQAVRERTEEDVRVIGNTIAVLEGAPEGRDPAVERALDELRRLRKGKEDALEGTMDSGLSRVEP